MAQKTLFERHPKSAVLVAQFIADFSTAEFALSTALSRFLGPQGLVITAAMFHQIQNISDRLDAFEHLVAGLADLSGPCQLLDSIRDLKKANQFRNKIAHGVWGEDGDPPHLTLNTWLTSKRRKQEKLTITDGDLRAQLKKLRDANGWLFGMGTGIVPLPEKLTQIPTQEDHIQEVHRDPKSAIAPEPPPTS